MIDNTGLKITDKHVFFWGGWPSNWATTKFSDKINGIQHEFATSEQYFMYMKAIIFNDEESAKKILDEINPKEAKKLGRKIKNFDDNIWKRLRMFAMYRANYLKYTQDKEMRETLLNPIFDNKVFVEASPYDTIWGIGMRMDEPGVDNEENWLGLNSLGDTLTGLRYLFKHSIIQ